MYRRQMYDAMTSCQETMWKKMGTSGGTKALEDLQVDVHMANIHSL